MKLYQNWKPDSIQGTSGKLCLKSMRALYKVPPFPFLAPTGGLRVQLLVFILVHQTKRWKDMVEILISHFIVF